MTKEQQELYTQTVKRLARAGVKDPTAQIIALAEEIERYRAKIRGLEERVAETPAAPFIYATKRRCTHYDPDLGRFVVPLHITEEDHDLIFQIGMTGRTHPDCVFGEVVDKLARYENQEEEQNHAT